MRFGSDNQTAAHPEIMAALARAASDGLGSALPAYGGDPLTARVNERFWELFEREVAVFFVPTGTAANSLALSAFSRPGGIVYCHRQAHIFNDECGAPEFLAGCRLAALGGERGKIDPSELRAAIEPLHPELVRAGKTGDEHHGQPMAVSLSQITELGAVYSAAEIGALSDSAHSRSAAVHMDGARFANAVAASGATPAELTWRAGVDVLSFGGTKNGCLAAEAVVFFNHETAADFPFLRKRGGHLFSKSWLVAAQFEAYLEGGRWLELAAHANAMARRLADGLRGFGVLALEPDANEVFAWLSLPAIASLRNAGAIFYEWASAGMGPDRPGQKLVRLVTSFDTRADEIERFADLVAGASDRRR